MTKSSLQNMSLKELMQGALELYEAIYHFGCFGASDVVLFEWHLEELESRGYALSENARFVKNKKKEAICTFIGQ